MEGNQDIIKIKSGKKSPEDLSIQKKRKKEKLEAKEKRDQIAKKEGEQSLAESVSENLNEIAAGSKKKAEGVDSKVREIASDLENQEIVAEIKQAGGDIKTQMQDAEVLASQDIKKKNLALNQSKAEEILEKIGLLEIKKNNGEEPDDPAEEAEKASELARLIEESKYIKEQEQLLTKLSGMYESYKSAVYGNESNKIISEIHKLSQKDENNGKQYRDKVNSIIQSEDVEKVNNGLKQLLEELKVKQDSEELNVAEEIMGDKEENIKSTNVEKAKVKEDFKEDFDYITEEYKGDSKGIMLTNLLKRIDQAGRDKDLELKGKVINELDKIGKADKNSAESGLKIETETLKNRSVELWDERSKILMEKNSQGKTDKFQAIEEEMTEIREELKGRDVKFELNKWVKEEKKEEEAEREGESPEEKKAEKTAEEKVETQEKTKEEKAEIFPDVLSGFDKLGIKELDLESIKSFSGLSEGQQLLALENLKQLNLGRIQEEAAVKYKKNTAESKFLGRIWQGISKKYQIAKLEKVTANKIEKGGMKAHQETLQQLVNGMQEFGPEVKMQNGKLEIQYASGFENLTPEQQKQVDEFNQIATEYSKTPYEWSLETANKKDRKKYEDMEEGYKKAKTNILSFKEIEIGKKDACLYMNDVEMKVKLNQFLNSNPDVEKQLQNIKDKKVWLRALANVVTERGIYAVGGYLTRAATISMIGLAGAPLAAAGMGGFMARRRAKGTLKERDVLARKGMEDKSKEAKDFVDAEYIHESIDFLINELDKESLDADKKDEIIRSLKFHIEDAKNKIEDGTVNYGGKENRLFNQYKLIKKISEGAVQVEYNWINNEKYQKDIEVIGEFLKKQDKKIFAAQKKYLRDQMVRGAIISAGFATAGYAIRHFAEELGWLGGHKEAIKPVEPDFSKADKATLEALGNLSDDDKEYIAKHGLHDYNIKKTLEDMPLKPEEAVKEVSPPVVEPPAKEAVKGMTPKGAAEAVAATAEKVEIKPLPEYKVQKNDNLWNIIGKMDEIKDLEGGRKSNAIANVIEAIKNDTDKLEALGFKNADDIHNLEVGDKIDLNEIKGILDNTIIGEGEDAESIVEHAQHLDEQTAESIKANDEFIKRFYEERPEIPLNEKTTEWIIKNPDVELDKVVYDKESGEIAIEEIRETAKVEEAVAEAAEPAPITEAWNNETREKSEQILNVKNIAPDDVEKINKIVNLEDGIQPNEESKLRFLAEHKELINNPKEVRHIFKLSKMAEVGFNKFGFLDAYRDMPDDIKFYKDQTKAEGYLQVFAGTKMQVGEGLKKIGVSGETWAKDTSGTVIVEDAFGENSIKVLLTEQKEVIAYKKRWYGGFKTIFKSKLSLDNLAEMKSKITGLPKEVLGGGNVEKTAEIEQTVPGIK